MMTRTAYSRKAKDYAAYRPEYTQEAIDALVEITGLDSSWVVADIGSGTGNVAKCLIGRAKRVFAVEPDDAMRHAAEELLGGHPAFRSIAGTAEQTTLPAKTADLVTVGQALHWFDQPAAQVEFERILKPTGRIALIWNRFGQQADPDLAVIFSAEECTRLSFSVTFKETWPQFIGGVRSAASSPSQSDVGYQKFEHEHRRLFDARAVDGLITVEYTTELAVGRSNRRRATT
jgi:ubiquinone/menaquinone biosynthesis C-methylase UbiE